MTGREFTGKGIGVAVLDTGLFPHADFSGRIRGFYDFLFYRRQPYDDNGHGTHVTGILAGDGRMSLGRYAGAAPGCSIVALKVLDRFGNGSKEDVLRAFQWIRRYREEYRIRVVNISVGTTCRTQNEQDALLDTVEQLWDEGLVVVAAAGNQGPRPGSITAPGSNKKVITVGSSDLLEGKGAVSGRGPTRECVCKPDVVAPGNHIVSCVPYEKGKPAAGGRPRIYGYGVKSGTSMSTPAVSGAIACVLEKDSTLTNVDIKMMLKESADDMQLPRNIQGWGRFNRQKFLNL
nr:S8 family peptidase [uncultured Blautia sp.]